MTWDLNYGTFLGGVLYSGLKGPYGQTWCDRFRNGSTISYNLDKFCTSYVYFGCVNYVHSVHTYRHCVYYVRTGRCPLKNARWAVGLNILGFRSDKKIAEFSVTSLWWTVLGLCLKLAFGWEGSSNKSNFWNLKWRLWRLHLYVFYVMYTYHIVL